MRKVIFLTAIVFLQFIFINAAPERKSLPKKVSFRRKSLKKVEQYKGTKIECGSCKNKIAKYYLPRHRALCHYDEFKHDPKILKINCFLQGLRV